ncbi:1241_t:CDS:2 [Diversispora eburnea]|uniref:1241_t:CDS:1 n=1 Tax=Diversispora eburnea TaxID=1213867 RepID=A0A9N9AV00_9GLOM|nr:1241_t:CDS:2 [Diversispora eburnea]
MILKYANEGNLRDYLKSKKKSLKWEDKHRMCFEIAKGLRCLHSEEIIHKDLHSKNILIDNGRMMIADLGLSRRLDETLSTSGHRGICKDHNPDQRPDIEEIIEILEKIIPSRSQEIPNIEESLVSDEDEKPYTESHSNSNSQLHLPDKLIKLYEDHIKIGSNKTEKKYSKWIKNHSLESLEIMFNYLKDNKDFPRRELLIGQFYENGFGITGNSKEAFKYFKKASSKKGDTIGHYKVGYCYYKDFAGLTGIANYMLGVMYANGHGIDKDISEAFRLFKEAAKSGYVPAQYWLADFYYEGTGTEKNSEKAQKWYQKCYDNGDYKDAGEKIDSLRNIG